MIPLEAQAELRTALAAQLVNRVKFDLFTQRTSALMIPGQEPCISCDDAEELAQDLARLSPLITLTVHQRGRDRELEKRLGIDRVPATVLRGMTNRPLVFYGLAMPPLFNTLLGALTYLSVGKVGLPPAAEKRLKRLREEVHLRVFVAGGDEESANQLETAYAFSVASKQVRVDGIEVGSFPTLVERLRLSHVPFTTINAQAGFAGRVSAETLAEQIFHAVTHRAITVERPDVLGVTPLELPQSRGPAEPTVRPSGLIVPGR